MFLRELFERTHTVGISFGRFNPPHKGHKEVWESASHDDHWYIGTNRHTNGAKDPLLFENKIEAMSTLYPGVLSHIIVETDWFTMANRIYEAHGAVDLNCYTDEDWVVKNLINYNGKESRHGYYNFKSINHVLTSRLSSATALREAVLNNDKIAFTESAGIAADTNINGTSYFDLVASAMALQTQESVGYIEVPSIKIGSKVSHTFLPRGGIIQQISGNSVVVKALHDDRVYKFNIQSIKPVKEEAAGVGIVDKQNSTCDVGPGTLHKNLKAFGLTGKVPKKSKSSKNETV